MDVMQRLPLMVRYIVIRRVHEIYSHISVLRGLRNILSNFEKFTWVMMPLLWGIKKGQIELLKKVADIAECLLCRFFGFFLLSIKSKIGIMFEVDYCYMSLLLLLFVFVLLFFALLFTPRASSCCGSMDFGLVFHQQNL